MNSFIAEILLLRKRAAVWVLLGFWSFMAILFSYILPYYAFTSGRSFRHGVAGLVLLQGLLPHSLVLNIMNSFPFFGGTMVLILAILSMGSEYSWGTLTPVLTQRASRLHFFFSKVAALAVALLPFVISVFMLGFIASMLIAWREGQSINLPQAWSVAKAFGACWFLMAVWASFGVLLAVLSRGTALAIGLGIVYGLALEGIISAFGQEIDLLNQVSKAFLRTNGYSLVSSLGVALQEGGAGGFIGPVVSGGQAFLLLLFYIFLFLGVAAAVLRRRDILGAG